MRSSLLILALSLLIVNAARGGGTVTNVQFYSEALQENRWVQVYTPEGYDPDGTTWYPSICFLHGANGDHLGYPELIAWADNLIGAGEIDPVILIKPDGSGCEWPPFWEGCGWVDSELQGRFETYLTADVVGFAEENYRIVRSPAKRALMGHSMGAFGSMHAALRHPDMYAAVAALSGYPDFEEFANQHVPIIRTEQHNAHGDPPWDYRPEEGLYTCGWLMFAGGFSPDLGNPPFYVDFPLDPYGEIDPDVWSRWLEHDPSAIAGALSPETAPAIYFDCGTNDPLHLYPINVAFHERLTELEIPHDFQSYVGGHWSVGRLQVALRFLDSAFGGTAAAEGGEPQTQGIDSILRFQVTNPSRERVELFFETSAPGSATVDAFDVQGRLRATVVRADLPSGPHHFTWETKGIAPGVYFVRLRTPADRETRTVVVP
ncbi:MAG: alpha/beta hydrolase-fold protein [Candidatus Eisenbacteria bacterium]|nr:alpha/beta hydrolase-fold protein [Candidatus Eisenbacteria bacterium]